MFRQVCTIEPSFFETTSGMHRRPIEVRHLINPLLPNGKICSRIVKISFLKTEGITEKISYERRAYKSIDDNSPS